MLQFFWNVNVKYGFGFNAWCENWTLDAKNSLAKNDQNLAYPGADTSYDSHWSCDQQYNKLELHR